MSYPFPPPPPSHDGGVPDQGGHPYAGYQPPYGYPPQPYGQQIQPYGQPTQPYGESMHPAPAPAGVNGLAIASLVTAFLFPPLAIVFGHLALSQIESRNEGGRGLAVTGLVLGYLFTVLTVVGLIIAIIFLVVLANAFDDYRLRSAPDEQPVVVASSYVTGTPVTVERNGFADVTWVGSTVRLAG